VMLKAGTKKMQQPLRVLDFGYTCAAEGPEWIVSESSFAHGPAHFPAMSSVEKCDATRSNRLPIIVDIKLFPCFMNCKFFWFPYSQGTSF
jgi:hypothetical protein